MHQSGIAEKILLEFNQDFAKGKIVSSEYISEYEKVYKQQALSYSENINIETQEIIPNAMQIDALTNLKALRNNGKNKALLISATGTGKTFLSAFDAKEFQPLKLLFIVHRQTIAKKAMRTFQKVFGTQKSFGIYSGNQKELDKDFIFSTVQTLSLKTHLNQFNEDHFDYIIIDESHRSSAKSYLKITNHFNPKFLLGMTATPERSDKNDIFSIFDHNIAYEIRLHQAMAEDMLCPFHYYGITDVSINETILEKNSDFNLLVSKERVSRIIEKSKFYGTDNGIIRGLIFCSRNNEAQELSELFNAEGFKTKHISGDTSNPDRDEAISLLESDDLSIKIDYIFTVDVFNEGIDIPKLNQIIMIRPTASAIIFIQQLGRGLRKHDTKSYLTIIDFIGNYQNNYLIPIALYGDRSLNKDVIRKMVSQGNNLLPGCSSVNFDQITKERIYESINTAKMRLLSDLKRDYQLLKFKLGRVPMMMDFLNYNSRDPISFIEYSRSYYNFINKIEQSNTTKLSKNASILLELISTEINNHKRIEESYILLELLHKGTCSIAKLRAEILEKYGYNISNKTIESCILNLNFLFVKKEKKLVPNSKTFVVQLSSTKISLSPNALLIFKDTVFKKFTLDSINYSIKMFDSYFKKELWQGGFILYQKYSRKDVFRILNFKENPVPLNVGGYLINTDNSTCPIFVNYHKEDSISESTKYEDQFINNSEFEWQSKSNRTLGSNDVKAIIREKESLRLLLFVKKNNDEGADFYYLGNMKPMQERIVQTTIADDKGKKLPVVKVCFKMETPVNKNIYNYIIEKPHIFKLPKNKESKKEIIAEEFTTKKIIKIEENQSILPKIPHYDFYTAAGSFSEMQSNKEFNLIDLPLKYKFNEDYFACKVIGESMNKRIPNGAICIFKKNVEGSRSGKILLIENFDIQDPDFDSAFTVKTYASQKIVTEEGYEHTEILLRPNSFDSSYTDIVVNEDNAKEMYVVGEFVCVLSDPT
jgi:superfamily II DNA or RNA helicase/SOS-response transcriptional repressor LexA